jgi:hypothetical protein
MKAERISDRVTRITLHMVSWQVSEVTGVQIQDRPGCGTAVQYLIRAENTTPWAAYAATELRLDRPQETCMMEFDDGWRLSPQRR